MKDVDTRRQQPNERTLKWTWDEDPCHVEDIIELQLHSSDLCTVVGPDLKYHDSNFILQLTFPELSSISYIMCALHYISTVCIPLPIYNQV